MFRARIERSRRAVGNTDLLVAGVAGLVCLGALTLIFVLGIEI